MNFLHPEFLWALLFLAIPIIVHLFNLRRYKKVFFSNTALLKRFVNETQKTSKLKKRILLLCRLLALLFIILAFVQPFLRSDKSRTNGLISVCIYIDNSQSMALPSKNIRALEEAKEKALSIINSLQNQANYQILGNDFSGNQLQLLSYQEAIGAVKNLEISSQNRTIQEIWTKQKNTLATANNENKLLYWISDFQSNQMQMKEQIDEKVNLIPIIHQNIKNISIDTAYIASPAIKINQNIKIVFNLKRAKEDQTVSTLVSLTQNDKTKASKEIKWNNNNTISDSFSFGAVNTGWQHLKITAKDASLRFDNEYLFSFYISPKPSVTLISQGYESKFLVNALKSDENFDIHSFSNTSLPASEAKSSQLIILNQLVKPTVEDAKRIEEILTSGKNMLIVMPPDAQNGSYNRFLEALGLSTIQSLQQNPARIKQINTQDPLLQDIFQSIDKLSDLPSSKAYYSLSNQSKRGKETLIAFDNSQPFLLRYSTLGSGNIYFMTSLLAPDKSEFVFSSIFAPIMYKLAAISTMSRSHSYFIGTNRSLEIPVGKSSKDEIFKAVKDNVNSIPPQRQFGQMLTVSLDGNFKESGFYQIQNSKSETVQEIALNHSRMESDLDFINPSDLESQFRGSEVSVDDGSSVYLRSLKSISSSQLWKLWIILGLLFLVLEMLIVFFWNRLEPFFKR
jgi:hypothetical protein